ncbi:hypothetical protein [Novipirellula artificiosorum]|uniref:Uncharacterized protein n=1 Tax=Novipirellula artificiosorum TaxID=2528016 RepID=A0A5C6D9R4_9BACT|nr:hypothetical protein [Novipirellula artificiosorum]TWU33863.1 hypothetical protein Poly41_48630 [Novipirellula artificiosorum]
MIKFHFVTPVYACSGDRMAENIEDGDGAKPALTVLPFQFSNSRRLHRRMALSFSQVL